MLDAAADRLGDASRADFETRVEAARMGFIFAQGRDGQQQYDRWRRKSRRAPSLTGDALEQAVMGLAAMFPGQVIRGVMPSGGV